MRTQVARPAIVAVVRLFSGMACRFGGHAHSSGVTRHSGGHETIHSFLCLLPNRKQDKQETNKQKTNRKTGQV
jgi:hypothetical protein